MDGAGLVSCVQGFLRNGGASLLQVANAPDELVDKLEAFNASQTVAV
jgi:hypothetical protein